LPPPASIIFFTLITGTLGKFLDNHVSNFSQFSTCFILFSTTIRFSLFFLFLPLPLPLPFLFFVGLSESLPSVSACASSEDASSSFNMPSNIISLIRSSTRSRLTSEFFSIIDLSVLSVISFILSLKFSSVISPGISIKDITFSLPSAKGIVTLFIVLPSGLNRLFPFLPFPKSTGIFFEPLCFFPFFLLSFLTLRLSSVLKKYMFSLLGLLSSDLSKVVVSGGLVLEPLPSAFLLDNK